MGTDMFAFIEYDKSEYYEKLHSSNHGKKEPFSEDIYCISKDSGLYTGSKDYLFFAAIAGVRNESLKEPLFNPRGLPINQSIALQNAIQKNGFNELNKIGYLTNEEIKLALEHFNANRANLSFESNTILNIMEDLENRLGKDRVRLVFGFE